MALIVLLNFQKEDSNFYFNAVDTFLNQCKSVNLLINASKTKEMVVSFSRSYGIYDYLFIDNNVIEKVEDFKYLGTFFSCDLKWQSNTDYIYRKLRQRFYAFSKFKHFKPTSKQKQHFIESLIFPVLA